VSSQIHAGAKSECLASVGLRGTAQRQAEEHRQAKPPL
jgi:hypothetical protein